MSDLFKESSVLLVNEELLVFQPSLAVAVGLTEAIFVQQLHYWLKRSTNVRDGRRWVYNSLPEWQKQFPFWSESTIRRAIENLRKIGVVIVSKEYNRAAFDHTLWYSIDYDNLDGLAATISSPPQEPQDDPPQVTDRSSQIDKIGSVKMSGPSKSNRPQANSQLEQTNTRDYTKITTEITTETTEKNTQVGEPTEGAALAAAVDEALQEEAATETDASTPPLSKAAWDDFCKALLWVCYGHQEMTALSGKPREELFAEAKRIAKMGFTIDDLRDWFTEKWKPLSKYKTAGIRPKPFEVRERIPTVRDRKALMSSYSSYQLPAPASKHPQPEETGSGDDAWELMRKHHFSDEGQREIVDDICVMDVYEDDAGVRIYEVFGGKRSEWIASRFSWQLERELRAILRRKVRVVFLAEDVCGSLSTKDAVLVVADGDWTGDNERLDVAIQSHGVVEAAH